MLDFNRNNRYKHLIERNKFSNLVDIVESFKIISKSLYTIFDSIIFMNRYHHYVYCNSTFITKTNIKRISKFKSNPLILKNSYEYRIPFNEISH